MVFDVVNWVVIPILIFLSRILDVGLGTVRVVVVNKGLRVLASVIGFFEISVWLIAVRQILTSMDNPVWFLAYAAGFAAGTYVGVVITDRLSLGKVLVRIMTKKNPRALIADLKENNFGVTVTKTEEKYSKGQLILSVIESKKLPVLVKIIHKHNPRAFFSVEEIKKASGGYFAPALKPPRPALFRMGGIARKGK